MRRTTVKVEPGRLRIAIMEHGKLLLQNGFEDDLKYAAGVDTSDVIPYFSTNVLKSLSDLKESK